MYVITVVAIFQARLAPSRFRRKVLQPLGPYHTVISSMLKKVSRCKSLPQVVFAIPDTQDNLELAAYLKNLGCEVHLGSEGDVRSRFIDVARQTRAGLVVRLTGDCPLVDQELVDSVVHLAYESGAEYTSNINPRSSPKGLEVEVFTSDALELSVATFHSELDIEHVTWSMRQSGQFSTSNFSIPQDLSGLRWVIDHPEDIQRLRLQLPKDFVEMSWKELVSSGASGGTDAGKSA